MSRVQGKELKQCGPLRIELRGEDGYYPEYNVIYSAEQDWGCEAGTDVTTVISTGSKPWAYAIYRACHRLLSGIKEQCECAERTCEVIGDFVHDEPVQCSACDFNYDDVIGGSAAWITENITHCPGCGARIEKEAQDDA